MTDEQINESMADDLSAYPIEVQRREMLTVIAKLVHALEWAESYARPNCPDLLKMEMPAAIIAGRKVLGEWPEGQTAAE